MSISYHIANKIPIHKANSNSLDTKLTQELELIKTKMSLNRERHI